MTKCLYLSNNKPSRKSVLEFIAWLKDNYPDCAFTEVNVSKVSHPADNSGHYQGRVEAPVEWAEEAKAADRLAVLEAARRILAV